MVERFNLVPGPRLSAQSGLALVVLSLAFILGSLSFKVFAAILIALSAITRLTDGGYVIVSQGRLTIRGHFRGTIDFGDIALAKPIVIARTDPKDAAGTPDSRRSGVVLTFHRSKWLFSTAGIPAFLPRLSVRLFLSPADSHALVSILSRND